MGLAISRHFTSWLSERRYSLISFPHCRRFCLESGGTHPRLRRSIHMSVAHTRPGFDHGFTKASAHWESFVGFTYLPRSRCPVARRLRLPNCERHGSFGPGLSSGTVTRWLDCPVLNPCALWLGRRPARNPPIRVGYWDLPARRIFGCSTRKKPGGACCQGSGWSTSRGLSSMPHRVTVHYIPGTLRSRGSCPALALLSSLGGPVRRHAYGPLSGLPSLSVASRQP
jgi:hypothetical protein